MVNKGASELSVSPSSRTRSHWQRARKHLVVAKLGMVRGDALKRRTGMCINKNNSSVKKRWPGR